MFWKLALAEKKKSCKKQTTKFVWEVAIIQSETFSAPLKKVFCTSESEGRKTHRSQKQSKQSEKHSCKNNVAKIKQKDFQRKDKHFGACLQLVYISTGRAKNCPNKSLISLNRTVNIVVLTFKWRIRYLIGNSPFFNRFPVKKRAPRVCFK